MHALTIELDDKHLTALNELCDTQGMPRAALLRQALRLYQLVQNRAKDGQELAFIKDGKVIPMIVPTMSLAATAKEQP